jgi:outer membrane immunogenic protein
MKALFCALGLVSFFAAPAFAADLPTSKPAPAPPPAVYNWNGFYVGGHFGGGGGSTSSDAYFLDGSFATNAAFDRSGVFGGGQVGYNWMFTPNWLLGAEADLSASNIQGSLTSCSTTGCAHSVSTDNVFGTARARLGYAWNNWLFYGTGGVAWLNSDTKRTIACVGARCPAVTARSVLVNQEASASGTDGGWALGGGVEWGFAPSWSLQLQYLHLQSDGVSRDFSYSLPAGFRHVVSDSAIDTGQVGVNYRF